MNTRRKGRGSHLNPANRFVAEYHVPNLEQVEYDDEYLASLNQRPTTYLPDHSKSVVSENNSPDVGFRYSLNPYRGCQHGCAYCYARPTHEYLGLNAGLDFESKILVKYNAPDLFRDFLSKDDWRPGPVVMSGVTDPYQPIERRLQITRQCLEVAASANQPISIITKNALVVRDLDILGSMASLGLVHVNISITTLDAGLAGTMEPRTSMPAARIRAVKELTSAGVPVRVMVAPIIPGLNDSEVPAILAAAKEAGAQTAGFTMLRLPLTVAPVFLEWLERTQPQRKQRVEARIRDMRGGKLNDANFGSRMRGSGAMAEQVHEMFRLFAKRHGLDGGLPPQDCTRFRPPSRVSGQLQMF
jgi:DNA repair photolyase